MLMFVLQNSISFARLGINDFVLFGQLYLVYMLILFALFDIVEIAQGQATRWTWGEREESLRFK